VTCRLFHRWSEWEYEFEECPDGEMRTYEIRTRHCKRRRCDMFEEGIKCVSSSPEVVLGLTP
jgi:hypothetical protein